MLIIEPPSSSQYKIGIIIIVVTDLVMSVLSFLPVVMNRKWALGSVNLSVAFGHVSTERREFKPRFTLYFLSVSVVMYYVSSLCFMLCTN